MTNRERLLLRRAETIHRKACELAEGVEKLFGQDGVVWPTAQNLHCFAREMVTYLSPEGEPSGHGELRRRCMTIEETGI